MGAATILAYAATGATPTLATAEGGVSWSRDDSITGVTPIPIPSATGNHYSLLRYLCVYVTVAGSTNVTNRTIREASATPTGTQLLWLDQATYTQNTGTQGTSAGQYPVDDTAANGTIPGTPAWAAVGTSTSQWDNTSHSTGSTGRNGDYVQVCLQVSGNCTSGAGSAVPRPNLILAYDEA
jgi:hypothetical protein